MIGKWGKSGLGDTVKGGWRKSNELFSTYLRDLRTFKFSTYHVTHGHFSFVSLSVVAV